MLMNFLLAVLSGLLLAVPAYFLLHHFLLRRLFVRRNLRCIAPYVPKRIESRPDQEN
jgi:hypothetical protein